jgi:hypothetical protein
MNPPPYEDGTDSSETSASNTQTPGIYPKESILQYQYNLYNLYFFSYQPRLFYYHIFCNNFCAHFNFLCALISHRVCARTRAQLRGNIGQYHTPAVLAPGKTPYPLYMRLDGPREVDMENLATHEQKRSGHSLL